MAQELEDGEFWLPSEFLTEDDLLMDFNKKEGGGFLCRSGTSSGFHADLISPVESTTTETESDEDDFIGFLSRKMSYSTLNDSTKGFKTSGSPQSTLCGCKPVSSPGNPKCVSEVSSPPGSQGALSWDLLYEAAKKVARLRVNEAAAACFQPKMIYPPLKPSPVTVPRLDRCQVSGFYQNPKTQFHLTYRKMQAIQFQQLKNEAWGHGQRGNQLNEGRIGGIEETQGFSAAAWPNLLQSQRQTQQVRSSGMRTVFIAENGAKKERAGTGVFLPRGYGTNPANTSRKPGSTVLLPDRVVHAFSLNLGSVHASAQAAKSRDVQSSADGCYKRINTTRIAQQGRNLIPQPVVSQELCLPLEWTY